MTPPSLAHRRSGPFTHWPRATDAVLAGVVLLAAVFVTGTESGGLAWRPVADLSAPVVLGR